VSTDPDGDTPAAVQDFSRAHRLDHNWHYLVGSRAQLAAVWSAYGIVATPDPGKPTITHTDAIFLIDKQGRERVLLRTEALDDVLVNDLRILAKER
jgi:cytochrome oxidase Cu insertion factor (SCO1/SenC/PrrC family)